MHRRLYGTRSSNACRVPSCTSVRERSHPARRRGPDRGDIDAIRCRRRGPSKWRRPGSGCRARARLHRSGTPGYGRPTAARCRAPARSDRLAARPCSPSPRQTTPSCRRCSPPAPRRRIPCPRPAHDDRVGERREASLLSVRPAPDPPADAVGRDRLAAVVRRYPLGADRRSCSAAASVGAPRACAARSRRARPWWRGLALTTRASGPRRSTPAPGCCTRCSRRGP